MSALSEEFQQARVDLRAAATQRSMTNQERVILALVGIGHALLANAAPGTAGEARNDEKLAGG